MYYKIVNKESEVYQKLHHMRSEELQFEKDNKKAIEEKVGLKWQLFLGRIGQQNFGRVTTYSGFVFKEPEKVDLNIWKKSKQIENGFVPNLRTKAGREMDKFLRNGLKRHWYGDVYDNLGLEHPGGRFTFPFVSICGKVILLMIDDELTDANIIEITKTEFTQILEKAHKSN